MREDLILELDRGRGIDVVVESGTGVSYYGESMGGLFADSKVYLAQSNDENVQQPSRSQPMNSIMRTWCCST